MTMLTPPSPPAEPLLGHLRLISKDTPAFLRMLGREYGDISTFRLGRRVVYFVNNPDYIQQVVQSKQFARTNLTRKLLSSFLGDGLFSQEGALHLQQRRLMQPAFHRERYPLYANVMVDNSLAAVSDWRDGETRSITQAMMHLTLEIVSQALFGSSTSTEARQIGEALALVQKAIDNEYELYSLLPDWLPIMRTGKYRQAVAILQTATQKIVRERRKAGQETGDLLSMLLVAQDEDGSCLTDDQVTGQVLSMLFAGHETTANTMAWTWYLLARNPEARNKLSAELDAVLGDRVPTMADLPQLKYTDMVTKESLRLYPSAWYAERTPNETTQIGPYTVKAGTSVAVSVYVTQRDGRFFDQPDQFMPERFSEENIERIPKFAYMPFGAGSHQCIGNMFASMEVRLMVATIAQRFELHTLPNYEPQQRAVVTMGIRDELPMRISTRRVQA